MRDDACGGGPRGVARGPAVTVRFNPPPGWPAPPASWLPGDDWLPDPAWPPPPADWSWWTVTARPATAPGPQPLGRLGRPSFPVATRAAQSTVSLAALFPERAREGASYGAGPSGYAAGSAPHPGCAPRRVGSTTARPRSGPSRGPSRCSTTRRRTISRRGPSTSTSSPTRRPTSRLRAGRQQRVRPASGSPRCCASSVTGRACGRSSLSAGRRRSRSPTCWLPRSRRRWVARAGPPTARARQAPAGRRGFFRRRRDRSDAGHGDVAAGGRSRSVSAVRALRAVRLAPLAGVDVSALTRRALEARRLKDLDAALAVEQDLRSLHRTSFASIRRPVVPPLPSARPRRGG